MFIVLPLCLKKDLESLAWSSIVSLISVSGLVIVVTYRAIEMFGHAPINQSTNQSIHQSTNQLISFFGPAISQGIGSMSFVFVCHDVAFDVYNSLPRPTSQSIKQSINQWTYVSMIAVGLALMPMLIMGCFCVASINQSILPNILSNFSSADQSINQSTNVSINLSKCMLGLSMLLTMPANAHAAREAVKQLIHVTNQSTTQSANRSTKPPTNPSTIHMIVTIGMLVSALMIALFFDNLSTIQSMIGSFCSVTLAFILPAAASIRARQIDQSTNQSTNRPSNWWSLISRSSIGPWCLLSIGLGILGNAIVQLIIGSF